MLVASSVRHRRTAKLTGLCLAVASLWLASNVLQRYALLSAMPLTAVEFKLATETESAPTSSEFAVVEEHLAAIYKDGTQELRVTAEFDKRLSMAISHIAIHSGVFPNTTKTLIENSFPGANGSKLAMLVECFYYYKQSETLILDEMASLSSTDGGIPDLTALQAAYFGEAFSRALFSDYHHLYQQMGAVISGNRPPLDTQLAQNETSTIPPTHKQACAPLATAFTL